MTTPKPVRDVETVAFYAGTQGASHEPMLAQIAAQFEASRAVLRQRAVRALKRLEARIAVLGDRKERADRRLEELRSESGGRRPALLMPLMWLIASIAAVGGEIVLIGPVFDGLGIGDPNLQRFAALVVVITSAGLFEQVFRMARGSTPSVTTAMPRPSRARFVGMVALATFAATLLFVFGMWRAEEVIFAASVSTALWTRFVAEHPDLTRACLTLLTLGLPLFVAVTANWGIRELTLAVGWRAAERRIAQCAESLQRLAKRHDEEAASRAEELTHSVQEERSATESFVEHYELGRLLGARREHVGWLLLRGAALTLLLIGGCIIVDPLLTYRLPASSTRLMLYGIATAGIATLWVSHALARRERPTPHQVFRSRAVRFRHDATVFRVGSRPSGHDHDHDPNLAPPQGNGARLALHGRSILTEGRCER